MSTKCFNAGAVITAPLMKLFSTVCTHIVWIIQSDQIGVEIRHIEYEYLRPNPNAYYNWGLLK